jgi:DNA polymerase III epsilon subunit-like protein
VASTDTYVSVDIEADGRIPGESSLLSLGAVAVDRPGETFYAELKPISERFLPEALAVSGLDRARLAAEGLDPAEAMARFCAWVGGLGGHPVFVSFSSWDWVFVYYYLVRFAGRSPFGHSSLDLKSYYAGRFGADFRATAKRRIARDNPALLADLGPHTHNALDDAREQAEIFRRMRGSPVA